LSKERTNNKICNLSHEAGNDLTKFRQNVILLTYRDKFSSISESTVHSI